MAINDYLEQIKNAVYGEQVRGAIHDAIQQCYEDASGGGAPTIASSVASMTDTSKLYLYVGTESGYVKGHWYYYDGTNWMDGGKYGDFEAVVINERLVIS